jgi:hypothetical protein
MLEAALSALASTVDGADVLHVPVSRVSTMFKLPRGNHDAKKKAASAAMHRLIDDGEVEVSDRAKAYIAGLARDHDVADALLQFVWFHRKGRAENICVIPGIKRMTDPARWAAARKRRAAKETQRKVALAKLKRKPAAAAKKKKLGKLPPAKRRCLNARE